VLTNLFLARRTSVLVLRVDVFAKNASPGVDVSTSSQQVLPGGTIRNEADIGLNGALPIGA
jgi:hypothetical protein